MNDAFKNPYNTYDGLIIVGRTCKDTNKKLNEIVAEYINPLANIGVIQHTSCLKLREDFPEKNILELECSYDTPINMEHAHRDCVIINNSFSTGELVPPLIAEAITSSNPYIILMEGESEELSLLKLLPEYTKNNISMEVLEDRQTLFINTNMRGFSKGRG